MSTNYVIKPGDTLSAIAQKYGTSVDALQKSNGISNPNLIIAGKTLTIPSASPVGSKVEGSANTGYTYTPFEYENFTPSEETNTALGNKTNFDKAVSGYEDFVDNTGLADYIQKWKERPDFSYDFNADSLYQQYKDKYIQQGKMAMADAIGQASAMTGGYGNSYAASVGNQAYQSHLQQLNDVIPELYQLAYNRYNQEGQDLLNTISLLQGERDFAYGKHNDEYNKLLGQQKYWGDMYLGLYDRDQGMYDSNRDFAQSEHHTVEGSKYDSWRDAIEDEQWQKNYDLSNRELAMKEEAWQLEKDVMVNQNDGGDYRVTKDETGKLVVEATPSIPSGVAEKAKSFTSNEALASYLDKQTELGVISPEQADQLYSEHMDVNEKYVKNEDGTSSISYRDMVGSTKGWTVKNDGGTNWFWGIDNNAIVESPNGELIRLDNLLDKLVAEGMDKKAAKDAIKKLQKNLDI